MYLMLFVLYFLALNIISKNKCQYFPPFSHAFLHCFLYFVFCILYSEIYILNSVLCILQITGWAIPGGSGSHPPPPALLTPLGEVLGVEVMGRRVCLMEEVEKVEGVEEAVEETVRGRW